MEKRREVMEIPEEYKLKCDLCIPERYKHMALSSRERPAIPACNINTVPGDMNERGCAFAGARGVIGGPIGDCIQVVHSPAGCAWYQWGTRRNLSAIYAWSGPDKLCNDSHNRRRAITTDLDEKDVVFGASEKLKDACLEAWRLAPGAGGILIYITCTSGLIGDDCYAVAREVEKKLKKPVFVIDAPGFCGVSQSKGHHEFNVQFYAQMVKYREKHPEVCMKPEEKTSYDINIIGEFNMDWDLALIKPLFEKLGCRIVSVFSGGERMRNLLKIPDAKLNVLHCQRSSTYISDLIKQGYEVPYVRASFFGIEQSASALRDVANFFDSDEMRERAEQIIEEEIKAITPALNFYREKLKGKKVGIYVGGPRVWHWPKVMKELGMDVVFGMCTFAHEDDYEKINARAEDGLFIVDAPNEFEIEECLDRFKPDLFLTGLKEKYLARKFGVPTVNSHSYEKGPYAMFRGMINFARDIYQGIYAPVWEFTRDDAFREEKSK